MMAKYRGINKVKHILILLVNDVVELIIIKYNINLFKL